MAEQNNSSFFNRLTKLFSTQAIVKVDKDGKRKVVDVDDRQQGSTNLLNLRDRYTKLQRSFYGDQMAAQSMAYHQVRRELFRDYDAMDNDPIISSALDIYADECTLKNEFGEVVQIKSKNEKVKDILENLFYDILNIEFNLWSWTRNMVKYGDFFLLQEIQPGVGIINVRPLPVYETERLENTDPNNRNYIKFKVNHDPNGKGEYENYEIVHFRLLSDTNFLPYGKAMIENGRRIWKQVSLMEDAMLIHRIMRAPDKRVFKIDIGNIPPNEVDTYMKGIIDQMKKVPYVDESTGEYNLKFNLQNMLEDYYLPVRGGQSGTEIDSLSGMEFGGIDDIEYLKNRLMAALKVPKAFIGYEEGVEGKATLAQQDIRFARSVERIQKIVLSELTKIAIVHLYAQGYEDEELVNFELELTGPSVIYEQEKSNLWSEKVSLVRDMKDLKMVSQEWMYKNIFNMSEDEWKLEQAKVINDLKLGFRQQQIEDEGNDPTKTGESFGTPHDLAALSQQEGDGGGGGGNSFSENEGGSPEGGFEGAGRPKEGNTYGKDKSPFGRDPIGNKQIDVSSDSPKVSSKTYEVLNNEKMSSMLTKMKQKQKTKQIITESLKTDEPYEEPSMLNEDNILDFDN